MKKITIDFIDHKKHRYSTSGDFYRVSPEKYKVVASKMKGWKFQFLLAFHELVEMGLCKSDGVSEASITRWDKKIARKFPDAEPGEFKDAPYHHQHMTAQHFEQLLAVALRVSWTDYLKALDNLWPKHPARNVPRVTKK